MTFGIRIRQARKVLSLTQKDTARRIGMSAQYLNDIERDRRAPPSDNFIEALADALVIQRDVLYFYAGRLPPDLLSGNATDRQILNGFDAFRLTLGRLKVQEAQP